MNPGGPAGFRYRDFAGEVSYETFSKVYYDHRGLPEKLGLWFSPTGPSSEKIIGVQTRNAAGLVTKRRTDVTTAMSFIESNWTYDKLGRVTSQVVEKGPGTNPVVRQDLSYNGTDDPKTLHHYLGTNHKQFDFTYDLRHQLKTATEVTSPGYFTAAYAYGAGGRLTSAKHEIPGSPPPGSEVLPRDVSYEYGDSDPERVTALLNTVGGGPLRTYVYDDAGNQTTRCNGPIAASVCVGESVDYRYDGKDQLRRVTKKLDGAVLGSEEYWYDGAGMRLTTVKRDAAGVTTEIIMIIGDVEAHYDGTSTTATHVYSHLSLGTPVARIDRTGASTTTLEFQFHGLANHTLAAVDQAGTINASFSYAPFGEVIEATNAGGATAGTAVHRRRNNDKYVDEVSGLSYYGARYYDNVLLGWTQSDPLSRFAPDAAWVQPRRANLYVNDLNNPLRYMDPDGRDGEAITRSPELRLLGTVAAQIGLGALADLAAAAIPPLAIGAAVLIAAVSHPAVDMLSTPEGRTQILTGAVIVGGWLGRPIYSMPKEPKDSPPTDTSPTSESTPGNPGNPRLGDPRYRLPSDTPADKIPKMADVKPGFLKKWLRKLWVGTPASQSDGTKSDGTTSGGHKPADADGDGNVTNEEESAWSSSMQ